VGVSVGRQCLRNEPVIVGPLHRVGHHFVERDNSQLIVQRVLMPAVFGCFDDRIDARFLISILDSCGDSFIVRGIDGRFVHAAVPSALLRDASFGAP
jgi:hypothetical protein